MKNIYTCPMHSEVHHEKLGTCPKCGMKLVLEKDIVHTAHKHSDKTSWKSYMPLIIIVTLILVTSLTLALRDYQVGDYTLENMISYFMSGFFIVFAGFKLMNLKGFAEGYATYDLLARRWSVYGYIYPFIELFFGLAMILSFQPILILWLELFVMIFSGVGVGLKLAKSEKFQCACLGTFLKVPLTKVTLIEDFGMALLAACMIYLLSC